MTLAVVRSWFQLTRNQQLLVAGALALFVVGMAARHLYLRHAGGARPTPEEQRMR